MPSTATLTIRLTPEVKEQLGRLANSTRRTKSFLAAQAIAGYVAREAEIIEGVEQGIADLRAGRLVPHDTAMTRLAAVLSAAERKKR